MAKTVMGYGGNEELSRLREQAAAQNAARSNSPSSAPIGNPGLGHAATLASPGPMQSGSAIPSGPAMPGRPQGGSQPPPYGAPPTAGAQARTMFVEGPPPAVGPRPHSPSSQPMQGPMVPGGMPLGGPSPMADVKTIAPDQNRLAPVLHSPSPHGSGPSMGGPAGYAQPSGGYNPSAPAVVPAYNPQPVPQVAPHVAPVPTATPPYMAPSHNRHQAARPIEPWKDTLRTMLFIWGGVLLACFAVPISLSPLVGNWNYVIDGEGTQKLGPLILAAVGLLSIVVGAIPMASAARGMIAALLGLAGIFVPMLVIGSLPEWQSLLSIGGTLVLVPALLVRNAYTESPLPRILITIGALAALAPFLIPQNGSIPLVELFKLLVDAPGQAKVGIIVLVAYVLVLVLSLLAWMPSPATAGAKVLAWVLVLFPLIIHGLGIGLSGGEGVDFEHALNPLILGWAYGASFGGGGATLVGALALGSAYVAISSYGLASVIGKQLE